MSLWICTFIYVGNWARICPTKCFDWLSWPIWKQKLLTGLFGLFGNKNLIILCSAAQFSNLVSLQESCVVHWHTVFCLLTLVMILLPLVLLLYIWKKLKKVWNHTEGAAIFCTEITHETDANLNYCMLSTISYVTIPVYP